MTIHEKYSESIEECRYISSRTLIVEMRTEHQKLHKISMYTLEANKPKEEQETFYYQLQNIIESLPQYDSIIMLGDYNARIGNKMIPGVKQRFSDDVLNENRK